MSTKYVEAVLSQSQARPLARLVLLVLADRANGDGIAWPAIRDTCKRTGLCRRAVTYLLTELEHGGELAVERRGGRRHRYRILLELHQPVHGVHGSDDGTSAQRARVPVHGVHGGVHGVHGHPNRHYNRQKNRSRAPRPAHEALRVPSPSRTPESDSPRKPARGAAAPDGRVPALVAAFATAHQVALGEPYLVAGGRDGKALKRALRTWDAPALTATLAPYFADEWTRDHGPTIPKWVGQVASLLARRAPSSSSSGFVG